VSSIDKVLSVELIKVALKDFEASKVLLEKGLYSQAVFMFQQSLEKALKAILLKLGLVRAEELVKRIGHSVIRNALELMMHRSLENFVILAGEALEWLNKAKEYLPKDQKIYVEEMHNVVKKIIVNMVRVSSTIFSEFSKRREEILAGIKDLRRLAFNQLNEKTKEELDKILDKVTSLSIVSILPSDAIEFISTLVSSITNLISTFPDDKRKEISEQYEKYLDNAMLSLHLAYELSIMMSWYALLEPNISNIRYPMLKKRKRKTILVSPLSIDENTVIVKWCKNIIKYIDKTNMLICLREFIEERIESLECKDILDVLKKYFNIITLAP